MRNPPTNPVAPFSVAPNVRPAVEKRAVERSMGRRLARRGIERQQPMAATGKLGGQIGAHEAKSARDDDSHEIRG